MAAACSIAKVRAASTAALFDVDDFNAIPDRYGHNVGVEVLKHFAPLLASNFGAPESQLA